jgi:hypothetical protein
MDDDVIFTRDLRRSGITGDEVERMVRRGELTRLRRGAYLRTTSGTKAVDSWDLRTPHLQLIDGTVPQLHPRAALSHGSAAAVHGLPLFASMLETVHVTRDRHGGGVIRPTLRVHGSTMRDVDRAVLDGRAVTCLSRTVVDLARTLPYDQAVAVADRGLALGVDPGQLAEHLEQARSWQGAPQARRVLAFADGRSESVGESFSRIRMIGLDLPTPVLQYEIFDENGNVIGRCDFAWPEHRTVGEFDGKVKYGRYRRPGETIEEAVHREKLREDAIRDQGWQMARWIWDDLANPLVIAGRILRAFGRGAR